MPVAKGNGSAPGQQLANTSALWLYFADWRIPSADNANDETRRPQSSHRRAAEITWKTLAEKKVMRSTVSSLVQLEAEGKCRQPGPITLGTVEICCALEEEWQ